MVIHEARIQLSDAEVDRLFHALADSTRRDIVARTIASPASVSQLAGYYDMSFPAVHKHVGVLVAAGLVTKARHGRETLVAANLEQLARARALLAQLEKDYLQRYSQLDAVLADD